MTDGGNDIPAGDGAAAHRSSLLRRVWYTPVRDALRGRLSARLDPMRVIAEAGLPRPLEELAWRVVSRTRLWRREKSEVARELAAHFADGLAAGRSAEDLVRDFGEAGGAARLIRRSKKRSRPWAWRAMVRGVKVCGVLVGVLLVLYAVLAARFWMSRPKVRVDYAARLNAPALAVPEKDRAWPVYRRALMELGRTPVALDESLPENLWDMWPTIEKDGPKWRVFVEYVTRNQGALARVREAAAMPHLGCVATDREDVELLRAINPAFTPGPPPSDGAPALVSVLLPHLGQFRSLARHLWADVHLALSDGADSEATGERVCGDVEAMVGLAEHSRDLPVVIGDVVSWAILQVAEENIGRVLSDRPGLLTDDQLIRLSHRLAGFGGGEKGFRPQFGGERMMFEDFVQRVYSDDGCGDGHVTAEGMAYMQRTVANGSTVTGAGRADGIEQAAKAALGPVDALVLAGRKDLVATYTRMMDHTERVSQLPLWRWDEPGVSVIDPAVEQMSASGPLGPSRYLVIALLMPAMRQLAITAHQSEQMRDGVEVAIALELYHRRTGAYPGSLEELVPRLLPAVPPDCFDGGPIKYRLEAGRPVVYSVGSDRKDDGGRVARLVDGRSDNNSVRRWRSREAMDAEMKAWPPAGERSRWGTADGDWILWPPVK